MYSKSIETWRQGQNLEQQERLNAGFSAETMEVRRQWENSQSTKNKHTHKTRKPQMRILYQAKLSFKNEGEIKIFPDKPKTKRICCQQTCFARNIKRNSLSWKQVKTESNSNIYKETKVL